MLTKPTVCFVESLGFLEEQTHKEGEIISRTLQLSGKRSAYAYIRTKQELKAVVAEFGESKHRYLHLSCHGVVDENNKATGFHLTTGQIVSDDFASLLAPHVGGGVAFSYHPAWQRAARLQARCFAKVSASPCSLR
jgi:hypothetical protein